MIGCKVTLTPVGRKLFLYLRPLDPFHNQEFRELTTATIAQPGKKNKSSKQVYINRTGAIVSSWEI